MIAVCFECGEAKQKPMAKCEFCKKKPSSRLERVASMALSSECLNELNLKKGSQFIKQARRLPKFHPNVHKKAIQLVESYIDVAADGNSDSIDLSSSFFDFEFAQNKSVEHITVHAIGKPEHVGDDYRPKNSQTKTYHTFQWEIGKDISAEQAALNKDLAGDVFVWYRWMGESWSWKCVTRMEFEQLKSVES